MAAVGSPTVASPFSPLAMLCATGKAQQARMDTFFKIMPSTASSSKGKGKGKSAKTKRKVVLALAANTARPWQPPHFL